jgi:hypothetical protein
MRSSAVLAALLGLVALSCGGPKLREPATVEPKTMNELCEIREGVSLTMEQAVCVARAAGLDVGEDRYSIRRGLSQKGLATWVVDEICDDANPKCIGIVVRQSDGEILDTRYLYVVREYGSAMR